MRLVLALTAIALVVSATRPAAAFHAGKVYGAQPGAGGGGGVFYTGSLTDRGMGCPLCHMDAPGRIGITGSSMPPELFTEGRYVPGTTYDVSLRLVGEHLGFANPLSNFNSMALRVEDGTGADAGSLAGYAGTAFYAYGDATIASDSTTTGATSWSFTWTAPTDGEVTLWLGVVDGNAAGTGPGMTLEDPLGDDVAMARLVLAPTVGGAERVAPTAPAAPEGTPCRWLDGVPSTDRASRVPRARRARPRAWRSRSGARAGGNPEGAGHTPRRRLPPPGRAPHTLRRPCSKLRGARRTS